MKKVCALLFITTCLLASFDSQAQQKPEAKKAEKDFPQIRQYWFVLLTKGPTRNQDSATTATIQKAHLDNITRLYEEGKIKVAGPFGDKGSDWQGLFIFDCPTKQEVEQLLQSDKAIASGRLNYEIHTWYTSPIGSFIPGKPASSNK